MRKIETEMNTAIATKKNWSKGNTEVFYNPDTDSSAVFLHGNMIADVKLSQPRPVIRLYDANWQTVTTKSRLNAILETFGLEGERVFAKNFDWKLMIRSQFGEVYDIPFFSGMRLA